MSVALITGAAHGQGRATALALAEDGYDIVALDVAAPLTYPPYPMGSTEELESLATEVEGRGRECLTAVADVRDFEAVDAAVTAAIMRGITWRATIHGPLRLMSIIASQASSVSSCARP